MLALGQKPLSAPRGCHQLVEATYSSCPPWPSPETLSWEFPGVQWLELCAFTANGSGLIPGQRTKIPQAVWHGQTNKKHKKAKNKTKKKFLRQKTKQTKKQRLSHDMAACFFKPNTGERNKIIYLSIYLSMYLSTYLCICLIITV